ncbi:recombinase family protein [Lachnospiraceae bacterium 54-53]
MRIKILEPILEAKQEKKRVCAYTRVSTDSKKQEDSLENQTETYELLICSNPEYEFAGVYSDQGISGYCENRPGFQEMLRKARAGAIDLIITKSISRFARNTVTVLKVARELKELGVGIFFEEQNINTLSGDGEMMLAVLSSFAQEESRSMSENNKWTIRKKFERGEIMINTGRFLGYDKDGYGCLTINHREALIVDFLYDMTLFGLGNSKLKSLMNYLGVKTVTGGEWNESTVNGVLVNEKYKGDYHLQKYFTPEDKRNQTRLNRGDVQSYYITDNHPAIVSEEKWNKVQAEREQRKIVRNIASGGTDKYQKRYLLSGMLVCPYCGNNLRRRQVYKKKIQWMCSTYIDAGKQVCRGIRIDDTEVQKQNITEPTVIEEVEQNGKKYYRYTSKAEFDSGCRKQPECAETANGSVLPGVNRPRRAVIKL